jgi:1-deoxy-D-xylulose-5-phosphate reductoisomerase
MTIPIQNALTYPEVTTCMYGRLNLVDCTFTFKSIDAEKYPIVRTAYNAASLDRAYPAAFNAANEVAVDAFMHGKIEFLDIPAVVEETLEADWGMMVVSFEQVLTLDNDARELAGQIVKRRSK